MQYIMHMAWRASSTKHCKVDITEIYEEFTALQLRLLQIQGFYSLENAFEFNEGRATVEAHIM